jgi:2-oxoglutarate ferredoxin oxidoreductase subunit alpha
MNTQTNCLTIKVAGESGQGINSIGEILTTALKRMGLYAFGYREYPSLIKGGVASYQIEVTEQESSYIHQKVDILVAIGRNSVYAYMDTVKNNGVILHSIKSLYLNEEQQKQLTSANITLHYFDAEELALTLGDKNVANVIMLAILWKALGFSEQYLVDSLNSRYGSKPKLLKMDLDAVTFVYKNDPIALQMHSFSKELQTHKGSNYTGDDLTIAGNEALALGALSAGLRAVYSYPMTPATSIFTYLANTSGETGILVKQAEDEITAIQMAIGSSFAGTRSLVVTSGGGFDLMTESLSMAGMTETPLVVVLAQRPGPSTGLPTWTSAADLEVALYSGHGEFPRAILAASDAVTSYSVIQKAFNIAEKYQLPVIVMTDKYIAESLYQVDKFAENLPISRGLTIDCDVSSDDRYKMTESGVSKRWIPGSSESTYKANSDEHEYDGSSTEDEEIAKEMIDKRLRKLKSLSATIEEPKYIGPTAPKYCFVGWGSNKSVVLEAIKSTHSESKIGYLHYETLWPLKTDTILQLINKKTKLIAVESNATAQFAKLLRQDIDSLTWHSKLLKYDGRPFYLEEVIKFIGELA